MQAEAATGDATSRSERKKRAGQRLFVGLSGPELSTYDRAMYQKIDPAGYLLPASILKRPAYARQLVHELKQLSKSHIPPHFAVDGEGGRVWRLSSAWPTPAQMAKNTSRMSAVVSAMAAELCAIGVNLNFAPVVERATPMLTDRAFSSNEKICDGAATVFIDTMHSFGIRSTAKHFPGHNQGSTDPHTDTVLVHLSSEQIIQTLLPPFYSAIDAGIDCIMAAHATFTKIDPSAPASISPVVIPTFLRKGLGFSGVVITDDLCMSAIQSVATYEQAVSGATHGDIDLMLVVHGIEAQFLTYEALIHQEELNPKKTFLSSKRLNTLKLNTPYKNAQQPPLSVIDSPAHRRLSEQFLQLE